MIFFLISSGISLKCIGLEPILKEKNKVEDKNKKGVGCKTLEGGDGGICVTSFQMPPYLLLEDQHRIRYLKVNVFLETAAVKELFLFFS